MYIYVVTLRLKAPVEPVTKKSSPFFGRKKPPVNDGLPDNMILVDTYLFDTTDDFAIVSTGATIWKKDFYKFWRGRIDDWNFSEYIIIDDISRLEETIDTMMARANEHIKDHPLLKQAPTPVRITADNTLPGLESFMPKPKQVPRTAK